SIPRRSIRTTLPSSRTAVAPGRCSPWRFRRASTDRCDVRLALVYVRCPSSAGHARCARLSHAVLLEPVQQAFPAVLGFVLAVAGAIIGVEGVRRVRVHDDLPGLPRFLEGLTHPLDRLDPDASVGPTVPAPDGRLQCQ